MRTIIALLLFCSSASAQCPWVVNVECQAAGGGVLLQWDGDPLLHSAFTIRRDGVAIATLPGSASSFSDSPGPGAWIYRVESNCNTGEACGIVVGVSAWFELSTVTAAPGDTVQVPLVVTMSGADAVNYGAMGLRHDAGVLVPLSVEVGADLALVNNGAGPDFFGVNLSPVGGPGVLFNFAASLMGGASSMLPAGSGLEVAVLEYAVGGAAPAGLSPIVFDGTLGDPPIGYGIAIENVPTNGIDPPISGGVFVSVPLLLRGDANLDGAFTISDPIRTLGYLFAGDPILCLEALDANATGTLDLVDVIAMLSELFLAGPQLPAPHPNCGQVPLVIGCSQSGCP